MADPAPNTLSAQEQADGWALLFDGTTMEHWRGFKQDAVPGGWKVVDGTIHRVDKAGDIITRETFDNFELKLDWKVDGPGNSGIFFRVDEEHDAVWHTGPEMQILNDDVHPDGKNPLTRAGGNYALHAPPEDVCRPLGEWNAVHIIVNGNHVALWLNGVNTVTYEIGSEDWERRVAESKFHKLPDYGRNTSGHIALQDHQDPVWFRNLKIKQL